MKYLLVVVISLALVGCGMKTSNAVTNSDVVIEKDDPDQVDYIASFEIYTNGVKRVFTDAMYLNQSSKVFIDDGANGIVRVKANEVTWEELFATLPMKLTPDCLITGTGQKFCKGVNHDLVFKVNGKLDEQALSRVIGEGDKLLVEYVKNR